jgi:hypothetical protein
MRMHSWIRRLRIAATVVVILAAIPRAVATIVMLLRFFGMELQTSPTPPEPKPGPQEPKRPGPGRCPPYHVYRDGKCFDVRR